MASLARAVSYRGGHSGVAVFQRAGAGAGTIGSWEGVVVVSEGGGDIIS